MFPRAHAAAVTEQHADTWLTEMYGMLTNASTTFNNEMFARCLCLLVVFLQLLNCSVYSTAFFSKNSSAFVSYLFPQATQNCSPSSSLLQLKHASNADQLQVKFLIGILRMHFVTNHNPINQQHL